MKHQLLSTLFGIALLATATPSQAATRTVFISGSDLVAGTATANSLGISLPDAAATTMAVNLTLPKGFKKNSTAKLSLRMIGGGLSCGVELVANGTIRVRPGSVTAVTPGPASGFTIVAPNVVPTPAAASQAFTKTFLLAPAAGATVVGQKAGDTVIVVIQRSGASGADTCASSVNVTSAKLTYQIP